MNRLLRAEIHRLFQNFVFRICLIFSAGLAIFIVFMRWYDVKKNQEIYEQLGTQYSNIDGLIFVGTLFLIYAVSVLIGIFVGTEYSDGTIRNKIIVGHRRKNIYFTKFVVCLSANFMIQMVFIVIVLVMGHFLLGGTTFGLQEILKFTATDLMASFALSTILLLISMSVQSKATGSVVGLLVTIVLFFSAMYIQNRLNEPEYYDGYSWVEEDTGEEITVEPEKNTQYLEGTKREIYEFMNDLLPVSQMYRVASFQSDHLGLLITYDFILIIISTGAGILIFEKKNLK